MAPGAYSSAIPVYVYSCIEMKSFFVDFEVADCSVCDAAVKRVSVWERRRWLRVFGGGGAGRVDDDVKTGERLDLEGLSKLFDLIENVGRSARRCSVFCGYAYVPRVVLATRRQ